MSSSSVENQVKSSIQESQEFAAIKESTSFDMQIATSSESQAQAAIGQADSMTQMLQMQRDETNQGVLNPKMKDVSAGGKSGGMKQVVDKEELGKMQVKLKALDGQLADAKNKAEGARSEAGASTIRRIELTSTEEEAGNGESEALAKASSLRTGLAGEAREEEVNPNEATDQLASTQTVSAQQVNKGTATNATETEGTEEETSTTQKVNESTGSTSSNTD